jgi:hypothetical protein
VLEKLPLLIWLQLAFKQSSERNMSWHLPAVNFLCLFYSRTYTLPQKCSLLYIKAAWKMKYWLHQDSVRQTLLLHSAAGRHVEWKWLFTEGLITVKLTMPFSVTDIKTIHCFIQSLQAYRSVQKISQPDQCSGDKAVFWAEMPQSLVQFTGISEDNSPHSHHSENLTS